MTDRLGKSASTSTPFFHLWRGAPLVVPLGKYFIILVSRLFPAATTSDIAGQHV